MKSNERVPQRTPVGVGKVFSHSSAILPSNKNTGSHRETAVYLDKDMQKVTKDKKLLIFKE